MILKAEFCNFIVVHFHTYPRGQGDPFKGPESLQKMRDLHRAISQEPELRMGFSNPESATRLL